MCRKLKGLAHLHHALLFRWRHFADDVIILALRWYLRYSLSYRDLEECSSHSGLPEIEGNRRVLGVRPDGLDDQVEFIGAVDLSRHA